MLFRLPLITGILDRRILLNYTLDPEYLAHFLPAPFKPRLYRGLGVGGVCMIRFAGLRPQWAPEFFGIDSENAAHRIAVEWEVDGKKFEGVYIPKRSTGSRFNYAVGGRIFPGVFQMSDFRSLESPPNYHLEIKGKKDPAPIVRFDGDVVDTLSKNSIFTNLDDASNFFAKGAIGYSLSKDRSHFQGMELKLLEWDIKPMKINEAFVWLFEKSKHFPPGTSKLDSAMLMRGLRHEWHKIPEIQTSDKKALLGEDL